MKTTLFIGALCIFTTACSSQATLKVYSQPSGAYIIEPSTGFVVGVAPALTYYNLDTSQSYYDAATGCFTLKGLTAIWVSGARTDLSSINVCGSPTGEYSITLNRNINTPNLAQDLEFEMQQKLLSAQQQQARAAQNASVAATLSALGAMQPSRCRSTRIGENVYTTCQ